MDLHTFSSYRDLCKIGGLASLVYSIYLRWRINRQISETNFLDIGSVQELFELINRSAMSMYLGVVMWLLAILFTLDK